MSRLHARLHAGRINAGWSAMCVSWQQAAVYAGKLSTLRWGWPIINGLQAELKSVYWKNFKFTQLTLNIFGCRRLLIGCRLTFIYQSWSDLELDFFLISITVYDKEQQNRAEWSLADKQQTLSYANALQHRESQHTYTKINTVYCIILYIYIYGWRTGLLKLSLSQCSHPPQTA